MNVLSWNRSVAYLLASGCDDGSFKARLCTPNKGERMTPEHYQHTLDFREPRSVFK